MRKLGFVGYLLVSTFLFVGVAQATPIDYSASEDVSAFGHLRQKDLEDLNKLGDIACGPSSATNSFLFLQNRWPDIYDNKLIPKNPGDINKDGKTDGYDGLLSAGTVLLGDDYMKTQKNSTTLRGDFFYGKQKYIEERVPGKTTYEIMDDPEMDKLDYVAFPLNARPPGYQAKAPTPQWLSSELKDGEDIEILFFGSSLKHYVTVTGLKWIDKDSNGKGPDGKIGPEDGDATISYINSARAPGDLEQTRTLIQHDGLLYFKSSSGEEIPIRFAVSESPVVVPEPGTILLFGTGLIGVVVLKRRHR